MKDPMRFIRKAIITKLGTISLSGQTVQVTNRVSLEL